ncbi:uncharacterized oxidoreductase YqkF-like [Anneissia japonica]|uniref:uncharacterized oxidoreductase YqkF-like n=1 Tax=Anneissia japonica TaxID=1529436 RepID=UPI0014255EE4|nr:uncharacterized oxidoreductase YqkF-like [Anneissia japonica]
MQRSLLGNSDLSVSPICLGCWQFNGGKADETWPAQPIEVSQSIVNKAIELGVNFFDTAEAYGMHRSEEVLGQCLGNRRSDVIIASKFGARIKTPYKATDIEESLRLSLEALRTDYVDLYQVHWPVMINDAKETVAELKRLQAKGQIKHYGVCNFGVENMKEFINAEGAGITNQLPYNLLWHPVEFEILPECVKNNMSVLAYSPLQQGLLTGKFYKPEDVPEGRRRTRHFNKDSTSMSRHGQEGAEDQTFKAIQSIREACGKEGVPMATASLSWLLKQQNVASVIVGCSKPEQLEQNCKIAQLSQELKKQLAEATDDLKSTFGNNPDMWAPSSRIY